MFLRLFLLPQELSGSWTITAREAKPSVNDEDGLKLAATTPFSTPAKRSQLSGLLAKAVRKMQNLPLRFGGQHCRIQAQTFPAWFWR
jgi:hypothetical protein